MKTTIMILGTMAAYTKLLPVFPEEQYHMRLHEGVLDHIPIADWIIAFHYRHKVPKSVLDAHPHRVLNIHPGLLPLNRGAHPDFWAWHDSTPHGITIHEMDEGIDTGSILVQTTVEVDKGSGHTFADVYADLDEIAVYTLKGTWDDIHAGYMIPKAQAGQATTHKVADLPKHLLPLGWNTPIEHMLTELAESVCCGD